MKHFPRPSDRPCLNLVATLGGRLTTEPVERLATTADLDAWLLEHGFAAAVEPADLMSATALREAIFGLLTAARDGSAPQPSDLDVVNQAAASERRRLRWHDGAFSGNAGSSAQSALSAIAHDAIDLLTGPDRRRLHRCQSDGCASLFLDTVTTRRRWCTSTGCGNRARVAAHRARTPQTESPRGRKDG